MSAARFATSVCLLLFLATSIDVFGANDVSVPQQTVLGIGDTTTIAVTGTVAASGDLTLTLAYNPNVVRIRFVRGGEPQAMLCTSPLITSDVAVSSSERRITVRCEFSVAVTNGGIVQFGLEGVAGIDTVGSIGVAGLTIDGVEQTDLQSTPGLVTRTGGIRATPQTIEGISGNYPNPFASTTRLDFVVERAGPVRVRMITMQGRLVYDFGTYEAQIGENTFPITIEPWNVSAGSYMIQVVTFNRSYLHPVTVMK